MLCLTIGWAITTTVSVAKAEEINIRQDESISEITSSINSKLDVIISTTSENRSILEGREKRLP
jgi:hypothetical protein